MRSAIALLFAVATVASADVTYSKDVSRILQGKCAQCHRPNDIAPFTLLSYDDAATYAEDIKRVITDKIMPPWKPVPGFNEFKGAYGLSDEERRTILDWIAGGTLQGDAADLPAPLPVSDSPWHLGQPDLILTMPEYTPPLRETDTYRCFVLPTGLTADRSLAAIQALPGNPQITHHVVVYLDVFDQSAALDGKDGQPGYTCFGGAGVQLTIGGVLGGWVPGNRTNRFQDDIGVPLPGKHNIIMQVHYHPNGRRGSDQTQLGIYFAEQSKVKHRLFYIPILNETFKIPPGEQNYEVLASQLIPLSAKAIIIAPHMHLLGRQIKVEVEDRDKTRRPLIYIDNWDFNWQGFYSFTEPTPVPAFSTIRVSTIYDNSAGNPKNPNNPLIPVGWGERTTDEMCLAFVGLIFDNELILPFSATQKR